MKSDETIDTLEAAGVPAGHISIDYASGTRSDRPELGRLLARLQAGTVHRVAARPASVAPGPGKTWPAGSGARD